MTIFEIDNELKALIDPETGEILDFEAFEALQMERDTKCENIALWIKELGYEAAAIEEEVKKLQKRLEVNGNKTERLKNYLALILEGQKFSCASCTVSYRKSEQAIIDDEALLPKKYFKKTVSVKPDKAGIKALLKEGRKIKGCHLEVKHNIQIK